LNQAGLDVDDPTDIVAAIVELYEPHVGQARELTIEVERVVAVHGEQIGRRQRAMQHQGGQQHPTRQR
jgi:hypothetical protein